MSVTQFTLLSSPPSADLHRRSWNSSPSSILFRSAIQSLRLKTIRAAGKKPWLSYHFRASLEETVGMGTQGKSDVGWMNFPFLSDAGRALMEDIAGILETELSSTLNSSRTPLDVRSFKNPQGNAEGSITIRSGKEGSKIDFVLGSWLHCDLPFGALNIATLIGMLNSDIDAPHLLFEFIQSGPNSLVLVLDLIPRKDLVLHPEYLKRFYEDTELESIRQELEKSSHAQPYVSSAIYIRAVISPTAILFKIDGQLLGEPLEGGLDRIISEAVYPAAKKVTKVWLEGHSTRGQCVQGLEREILEKRDSMIKTKGVEVDLSSNMPRLFGQDIANRVVEAFRKGE